LLRVLVTFEISSSAGSSLYKLHVKVKGLPTKKVTFLVVPPNGSKVKEVKLSRASLAVVTCAILSALVGITCILSDYIELKTNLPSREVLNRQVESQRGQIQVFAEKIQTMNEQMVALRDLEKKLRVIANVKQHADTDAVFGVGGALPEDLDPTYPLTEQDKGLIRDMHTQADYLNQILVVEKGAFEELHAYLQKQRSLLASTPALRPTKGWTSSAFGYRISPFTGLKEFHKGLDIATREGAPIIAPADGVITSVGDRGSLGKTLVIDHEHGMVTRYGHVKEWLVKPGQRVKRGDKIALVGNTGRTTGPHLHYEVLLNGLPVNPADYILN
jgi:murein DD-endopeptidase MepM/ murein hydrolase activator NlpD